MIQLMSIGKYTTPWIKDGITHYQKAIPKPWRFEIINLPENKAKDHTKIQTQARYTKAFEQRIEPMSYRIVMDQHGQMLDSSQMARILQSAFHHHRHVVLCIGGHLGFDDTFKQRADRVCSLSAMTLNHDLASLLTAEQLFRSWAIIHRHPYHDH